MKPIKMNPLPESEKQAAPKEAPMEGAQGDWNCASLGDRIQSLILKFLRKSPGVISLLINCVFSKRLKIRINSRNR
ncbi:MAG: hypothetical protein HUK40_16745 [Desulfobacter sp.]|nr:hypothetical protein [Desulfobacter sp.]